MKNFYWLALIITILFLFLSISSMVARENYDAKHDLHIESSFERRDLH